jgi:enoyl-CoA hydratase
MKGPKGNDFYCCFGLIVQQVSKDRFQGIPMDVIFKKDGPIAYVTINREKAYNALNGGVLKRLDEIFFELEDDHEIMVVIITGAGEKSFIAGADLKEIKEAKDRPGLIREGQKAISRIRRSSKVVMAVINGYALGGGTELALACDIRIASENARFGLPEAGLGLIPGYGGTQLTARIIGTGKAKYLMFTGEMITASQAYECGLVEKVFSKEKLMEEAKALAKRISSKGPLALKAIKRAVDKGIHLPVDEALEVELEEYATVAHSEDAEGGMDAFMEKKTAVFKGK